MLEPKKGMGLVSFPTRRDWGKIVADQIECEIVEKSCSEKPTTPGSRVQKHETGGVV